MMTRCLTAYTLGSLWVGIKTLEAIGKIPELLFDMELKQFEKEISSKTES